MTVTELLYVMQEADYLIHDALHDFADMLNAISWPAAFVFMVFFICRAWLKSELACEHDCPECSK